MLYDVGTGEFRTRGPVRLVGHKGCISSCAYSPDGERSVVPVTIYVYVHVPASYVHVHVLSIYTHMARKVLMNTATCGRVLATTTYGASSGAVSACACVRPMCRYNGGLWRIWRPAQRILRSFKANTKAFAESGYIYIAHGTFVYCCCLLLTLAWHCIPILLLWVAGTCELDQLSQLQWKW